MREQRKGEVEGEGRGVERGRGEEEGRGGEEGRGRGKVQRMDRQISNIY